MDRLDTYREAVRRLVEEYSRPSRGSKLTTIPIIDREGDHYGVIHTGWEGPLRVHAFVIHLDIIDGKVWIQLNNTDQLLTDELVAFGVRPEDIVIGFLPEPVYPLAGSGVG